MDQKTEQPGGDRAAEGVTVELGGDDISSTKKSPVPASQPHPQADDLGNIPSFMDRRTATVVTTAAMPPKRSWRDGLQVHPAADMFPMMSDAELDELSSNISRNGIQQPIVWLRNQLLDGRNRVAAVARITDARRREELIQAWKQGKNCIIHPVMSDPVAYVVSANIHRRHLTPEQKRDLIGTLLTANPEKSNRAIAEPLKVSHHTVESVRADLESTGQIAQLEKTIGKDGKARTTKPKDPETARKKTQKILHAVTDPPANDQAAVVAKITGCIIPTMPVSQAPKPTPPEPFVSSMSPVDVCVLEIRGLLDRAIECMSAEQRAQLFSDLRLEIDHLESMGANIPSDVPATVPDDLEIPACLRRIA